MPRKNREISPTGVYHVMLRGINRNNIFGDDQDCRKFLKVLRLVVNPVDSDNKPLPPLCHIHAYCLMGNHVHLLIAQAGEEISATMKRIGVAYASYYNKRYGRIGPLFQGRFRSEPVGNAGYFITLLRYIHMNPVRAQIVTSPAQYRWSSWHEYCDEDYVEKICCRKVPFSRMSWRQLRELVVNNVADELCKSNIETRRMTDDEALATINQLCQSRKLNEMPREDRTPIVLEAVSRGVGMRQLARLANIGLKSVYLTVSKSKDSK